LAHWTCRILVQPLFTIMRVLTVKRLFAFSVS